MNRSEKFYLLLCLINIGILVVAWIVNDEFNNMTVFTLALSSLGFIFSGDN